MEGLMAAILTCDKCKCNLVGLTPINVCLMKFDKAGNLKFNTLCPVCAIPFVAWLMEGTFNGGS
jgi:hypothetical protein